MKWMGLSLIGFSALQAQTLTVEADPDFYFDRGITFAAGVKPSPQSRWTFLGEFASRKVGPLANKERLQWRFGEATRFRFLGNRSGLFGELGINYGQFRNKEGVATRGLSMRPSLGIQWFPWKDKGCYFAPQGGVDHHPGRSGADKRFELRIGWQFGRE